MKGETGMFLYLIRNEGRNTYVSADRVKVRDGRLLFYRTRLFAFRDELVAAFNEWTFFKIDNKEK
jgi:hypothetical protein